MGTEGLVVTSEQGDNWNMGSDRVATLKLPSDQTGDSFMTFEETVPIGSGTPLHLHHGSDEAMYILSGEFSFKIGESVLTGGAGTWAYMPREVPHAWKNTGAEPGRALFIFTPARAGKLFEELRRRQIPFLATEPEVVRPLLEHFGWEILGPDPL